jgi:hypothetical protein
MSGDAAPLQVIAQGTISNGTSGGFASNCEGAVAARTGPGTYTLTLDAGLIGSVAVAATQARVMVQSLTALQVCTAVKTSTTVITVTSEVASTGVATDGTFDFIVFKSPS